MSFNELGLSFNIHLAIEQLGFEAPYPIQRQAIPQILKGGDVLGISPTGSGKTLAYVLPILSMMSDQMEGPKNRNICTLVLVPTRELCIQVQEVIFAVSKHLVPPIKSMAVHGGVSINPQMKGMYGVDVLVATPGRLIELIESKAVNLSRLEFFVLDEADKMLHEGFKTELDFILNCLPKKRQNLLFSATLTNIVAELQQTFLSKPKVVEVQEEPQEEKLINQVAYLLKDEEKGPFLRRLIVEKAMDRVLIFTASARKADNVSAKLVKNGINAEAIHGDKSQGTRTKLISEFKKGKLRVLVSTDLLARGMDIAFLPYVVNYELPRSPKDYIHRIGRTGRAESPGEAISLLTEEDLAHWKVIQKKMGTWVEILEGL